MHHLGTAPAISAGPFGLTPGEVTHDADGRAVNAELFAGDGAIMRSASGSKA